MILFVDNSSALCSTQRKHNKLWKHIMSNNNLDNQNSPVRTTSLSSASSSVKQTTSGISEKKKKKDKL